MEPELPSTDERVSQGRRYWATGLAAMFAFAALFGLVPYAWPQPDVAFFPLCIGVALAALNVVCMFKVIARQCWWQKLLATVPLLFFFLFLFLCFLWSLEQVS